MRHLFPRYRAPIIFWHAGIRTLALGADRLQQPAVGRELVELPVMLVAEPHEVVLVDADRVRKLEQSRTPGRQEIAVAIEDHDSMLGISIETIDPVL